MNRKTQQKLKELKEFSSDHLKDIGVQTRIINRMVETVNQETRKYQTTEMSPNKKLSAASDIHDANIQILNRKYDFLITQVRDLYSRIDGLVLLIESGVLKI